MEMGTSSGTGSCLAGEIWPVFSDPLEMGSSSSTPPMQMEFELYPAYGGILWMLEGPKDEHDLGECLNSAFSPSTNLNEIEHGTTIQTHAPAPPETENVKVRRRPLQAAAPLEKEEPPATTALGGERGGKEEDEEKEERREAGGSKDLLLCHRRRRPAPAATPREERGCASSIVDLLAYIPKSGSGPRGPRRKGLGWPNLFGDLCFASKGEKLRQRKNNKHWTPEEVKLLVDGVAEFGIGRWTELKDRWFSDSDSVRTAVHLKDKWRNLVKAYVFRPTSKKKGNAHLDKDLINKIQKLAVDYPYKK